jgi:hypothetical protein
MGPSQHVVEVLLGSHENKIHNNNQYQYPYISNFNAEEGDERGATERNILSCLHNQKQQR